MLRWALSLEAFVCTLSGIGTPESPVVLGLTIVTVLFTFYIQASTIQMSPKELPSLL